MSPQFTNQLQDLLRGFVQLPSKLGRIPAFVVSTDGMPLLSSLRDIVNYPYHRVPILDPIKLDWSNRTTASGAALEMVKGMRSWLLQPGIHYLMRPEVVMTIAFIYAYLSKDMTKFIRDKILGIQKNNISLRIAVAIHNFLLFVFSGVVAYRSWSIVLNQYYTNGFYNTYCDVDHALWKELGPLCIAFYISKFYEFVDSWILVLKHKEVSFLQVYHHTGIVLVMYGGVASHAAAWLQFVVTLNSAIHTVMYLYFFVKTIHPGVSILPPPVITTAQIAQFLVGISCTLGHLALGPSCGTSGSSRFFLALLHIYGIGLIALFLSFANQKYSKPKTE
jgi:GNS1/SUR4 family